MINKLRWKQRFENFEKAWNLLCEVVDKDINGFSDLEKEGIIQRFMFTFELAWKTMKDYLEYSGVELEQITPRAVIRAAFGSRIISDGQVWIDMLENRNIMSHTYNKTNLEKSIKRIFNEYGRAMGNLYDFMKKQEE